jgi:hypothetical protein
MLQNFEHCKEDRNCENDSNLKPNVVQESRQSTESMRSKDLKDSPYLAAPRQNNWTRHQVRCRKMLRRINTTLCLCILRRKYTKVRRGGAAEVINPVTNLFFRIDC